ncbi:MAG: alpha/beta fold hydrolase [Sandaracinaceae bacterium]|nr:alpha/beta fold hydrolase [Sandaracinaceae bacterium]
MRHSPLPLLLVALLASGCQYGAYFFRDTHRPMQALEVRMDPSTRRTCLLVFMPGMLNLPDAYLEHGFIADAVAASRRCDVVSVDAHFGYYRDRTLARQVGRDILLVAEERGYTDIWIVGSSLGGMGALMVARENPEHIDGVVLFGPFFGDDALVRTIADAGGLEAWDGGEGDPSVFEPDPAALWSWLRGYATHPERMPALYVGVGADDGMRTGVELLTALLPETHHGLAPGGHAWDTWRVLWRRLLVSPPWDPRGEEPRIDR